MTLSPTSRFFATCWVMVEPPCAPVRLGHRVHEGADHAALVDAVVLEEALVLGGDEGLLHELRNLGERHPMAAVVGLEQLGELGAVAVEHRGHAGQLAGP